ncbi:hypothetical protein ABZX95_23465 [Streptomyces sp. NPDC004232]|uniref:hypothetical protein n=1 Tax=Streptomyces sp. NPDC004232 TaxID=3154454 RepID=UPI001DA61515|nr:hypothetical protein [Streptomyces sp. tea 10]
MVAALPAQHFGRAVEAAGGADGEVLVDEGASAAIAAGDAVTEVADEGEGEFGAFVQAAADGFEAAGDRIPPALAREVDG